MNNRKHKSSSSSGRDRCIPRRFIAYNNLQARAGSAGLCCPPVIRRRRSFIEHGFCDTVSLEDQDLSLGLLGGDEFGMKGVSR
jgi:hypothetical protein